MVYVTPHNDNGQMFIYLKESRSAVIDFFNETAGDRADGTGRTCSNRVPLSGLSTCQ
jgi:hypothetical protein